MQKKLLQQIYIFFSKSSSALHTILIVQVPSVLRARSAASGELIVSKEESK
jgi:hypothetical protein